MLVEWGGHCLDCCTTQSWMRQAVDHLVLLQADLSCRFRCGPRHYNKPFILFRPPHLENFTSDMVEAVLKISIALNCQYMGVQRPQCELQLGHVLGRVHFKKIACAS